MGWQDEGKKRTIDAEGGTFALWILDLYLVYVCIYSLRIPIQLYFLSNTKLNSMHC